MADVETITNGKAVNSELTPEQAKALHAQLNQYYRKRNGGKKKQKAVLKPRGKINEIQKTYLVEESATDLSDIRDEPFSLDQHASQLFVKVGTERIKCVNTGKSIATSGAAVYRVFL